MIQHLRLAWAGFATRRKNKGSLPPLLSGDDLPGRWNVVDERTWPTGRVGPRTPWSERARANNSVTAWRSYHDGNDRWIWIQVVPLASESDAKTALPELGSRLLSNPKASHGVADERDVEVPPFPGAAAVWAREQHSVQAATGKNVGTTFLIGAAAGANIVVLSLSGSPTWDWGSALNVAQRQAELTMRTASGPESSPTTLS
ncbi:hypothetical protein [Streptomyces sp. NPDC002463]|uniref:hypothetical protein n=1 Tax=Streptomyces sp. NPDC002463 TaxID=3364645 RepID=UPI0036969132